MLLAAVVVAVARQLWWIYFVDPRGSEGFEALTYVFCPFLVLVFCFGSILIFLVVRSIRRTRQVHPTVVLILGLFVAFHLPLPEPPDTPEKLHFIAHRSDYEAVVELARNNALAQALPDCPAGFRPPTRFSHVSSAGCMFIYWNRQESDVLVLSVHFNPLDRFNHPVVYVENDHVENPCGYNIRNIYIEQRIDAHWYVCVHDWN